MRAAVLATSLGLGLGGLGPGACARRADRETAERPARDARPRAGATQVDARTHPKDTATSAHPDSVPPRAARTVGIAGNAGGGAPAGGNPATDVPPQMRPPAPFRYPGALYHRHVEGDVTLRLWVDSAGRVHPESTRVAESSGARLLDSAAVAGSARLEFTPARRGGRPAAAALLFPVHFRHPAARRG